MNWCFAIINGKLAEIFFERRDRTIKFVGHAYVKKTDYKTKSEQSSIDDDTKTHRFVYRAGTYKRDYIS